LTNGAVNLTAKDVNVKIDGVAEDGESVYAAATEYEAGINIDKYDLVSYNGNYYQAANDMHPTTDWATDSAANLTALPVYPAGTPYSANDYVLYN
jgi:alkaline phosphatase